MWSAIRNSARRSLRLISLPFIVSLETNLLICRGGSSAI
jgi:hypothetical protein